MRQKRGSIHGWIDIGLVAVGFEHMGDMPLAFDTYRSVTMVVKDALTAKERVLVEWAEEGLYRGAMVAWKYE